MKKIFLGLLFAGLALPVKAADLQFAESVPEETVYGSTAAARPQAVWLEMITASTKTLDLEQFYVADQAGEALEPVLTAVKAASKRGVKVRLIVDAVMMKETEKAMPALAEAGVETRVINFKKAGGGVQHAKFFIVDGRDSYVGSQNFDWRSLTQIHELGLRINSQKAAADLSRVFEADWAVAGGADPKKTYAKKGKGLVTAARPEKAAFGDAEVTYSLAFGPKGFVPAGLDTELTEMLKMIAAAKKTVRGQVMTYSLEEHGSKRWAELDSAFRKAAARGVAVELVFADWAMGGKADRDIKALAKTENIAVKISSLPQHSRGLIPFARVEHLKYLVADGAECFVTTSNWGPGYFLTSRGAAVIIKGAPAAAVLEDIFARVWNGPYALPVDSLKEYKPVKRS